MILSKKYGDDENSEISLLERKITSKMISFVHNQWGRVCSLSQPKKPDRNIEF
jgi:hypothetical protein